MSELKCPECEKILTEQEIMEAACDNCGDFWCCTSCLERDTELLLDEYEGEKHLEENKDE